MTRTITFLMFYIMVLLSNQVVGKEKAKEPKNEKQVVFYPYENTIVGDIQRVSTLKDRYLILQGRVIEVLKGNLKEGKTFKLVFVWNPNDPKKLITQCKKGKHVLGFNRVYRIKLARFADLDSPKKFIPAENLYLEKYDSKDLLRNLKSKIAKGPLTAEYTKAAFEAYLKKRWSINRIKDYCRPETQWITSALPISLYSVANWHGQLYKTDSAMPNGYKVEWYAVESGGIPQEYSIAVYAPNDSSVWQLEWGYPSLKKWSNDDYLKVRIGDEIQRSLFANSIVKNTRKSNLDWIQFKSRQNEKLMRNKKNKIVAYECTLKDKRLLRAKLDSVQNISEIFIDGQYNSKWNTVYENCSSNIEKSRKTFKK